MKAGKKVMKKEKKSLKTRIFSALLAIVLVLGGISVPKTEASAAGLVSGGGWLHVGTTGTAVFELGSSDRFSLVGADGFILRDNGRTLETHVKKTTPQMVTVQCIDHYLQRDYYAYWYYYATVTFDANGGTCSVGALNTYYNGYVLNAFPTPYRTGYTFLGWYTDRTGGAYMNDMSYYGGDTTLYAHWKQNHTHSWSYAASGDTITATCVGSGDCSNGYKTNPLKYTVNEVKNHTYDGNAYNTSENISVTNGITAVTKAAASYVFYKDAEKTQKTQPYTKDSEGNILSGEGAAHEGGAPIKAGTYYVTITLGGATITKSFTINKADRNCHVDMGAYTYGQDTLPTPTISHDEENPTVVHYYYSENEDGTNAVAWDSSNLTTSSLPVGTYYMYATVGETDDYNPVNKTALQRFTVEPADGDEHVSSEDYEGVYDGEPHGITLNVTVDDEDLTPTIYYYYYKEDGTRSEKQTTAPTFTEAGDYTVDYEVELANHKTVEGSADVRIEKADAEVVLSVEESKVYDGTTQASIKDYTVTGLKKESETVSIRGLNAYYTDSANVGENKPVLVETSGAEYSMDGENFADGLKNYNITYNVTEFTAAVTPKTAEISWGGDELTYNANAQSIEASVTNPSEGDAFNITYKNDTANNICNTATAVGEYKAEIADLGNSNYVLPSDGSDSKPWKIEYLEIGADLIKGSVGYNDYYVSKVTLGGYETEGYKVSTDDGVTWKGSIDCENQGEQSVTYRVMDPNGFITDRRTLNFKIDTGVPTGTITVSKGDLNFTESKNIFSYFFKKNAEVTITAADITSGVDTIEYQKVNKGDTYDADGTWTEYTAPFTISANDKSVIYARITDKAGNSTIINSAGVVVYTDSLASATATFTKKSEKDLMTDIDVNDNTIASVSIKSANSEDPEETVAAGNYALSKDEAGNTKLVLKYDYLQTLAVGKYTLTVNYNPYGETYTSGESKGEAPDSSVITLDVVRGEGSITNISNISKTYKNGEAVSAPTFETTNTRGDSDANVTIKYRKVGESDDTYTETAPSESGDYVVKITVKEDDNYEEVSALQTFTIGVNMIEVNAPNCDVTYDGKKHTISVATTNLEGTDKESQKITYGTMNASGRIEYSDDMPSYKDAGEYTVFYKITADNHADALGSATVKISPKTVNLNWSNTSFDYDGEPHVPSVEIDSNSIISGDEVKATVAGVETEAGNYTATVTSLGNGNYALPEESTTGFTIARKKIKATVTAFDKVYDGSKTAYVTATVNTEDIVDGDSLTISNLSCTFEDKNVGTDKKITINSSNMQVTGHCSENYEITVPPEAKADIKQREAILGWSQSDLTYTGEEQSITAYVSNAAPGESDGNGNYVADVFTITYGTNSVNTATDVGSYTATVTGLGNDNYKLPDKEDECRLEWSISYLKSGSMTVSGTKGDNDWYVSPVSLIPETGYEISADKINWSSSLDFNDSKETEQTASYYLKQTATGYISDVKTESFKIDTVNPTGTITVKDNSFKELLHSISFGHFYKDTVDVRINADDETSGVAKIEYKKLSGDESYLTDGEWTEYRSFSMNANDKSILYARITDNAGNSVIINSEGLVVYTDATASTDASFVKMSDKDLTTGITVHGNTVDSITLKTASGDSETVNGANYEIGTAGDSADKLVLKKDFLQSLEAGSYTLTVNYNPYGEVYNSESTGDAPGSSVINLTVVKAAGSITDISDVSKTYDGSAVIAPTFTTTNTRGLSDANVTVMYKEKFADDSTYSYSLPEACGSYLAKITVKTDENYNEVTEESEITIAHKWSEWETLREATEQKTGSKVRSCEGCDRKQYEIIPKLNGTSGSGESGESGESGGSSAGTVVTAIEIIGDPVCTEAFFNNKVNELTTATGIFTNDEKAAIESGANAKVWVEISEIDSLDEDVKNSMESKARAVLGSGVSKLYYFDASLYQSVTENGTTITKSITKPGVSISVSLKVPDTFALTNASLIRNYRVFRLHDGTIDFVNASYDKANGMLTFATERFSTYAIAYADSQIPTDDDDDDTTEVPTTKEPTVETVVPTLDVKTGSTGKKKDTVKNVHDFEIDLDIDEVAGEDGKEDNTSTDTSGTSDTGKNIENTETEKDTVKTVTKDKSEVPQTVEKQLEKALEEIKKMDSRIQEGPVVIPSVQSHAGETLDSSDGSIKTLVVTVPEELQKEGRVFYLMTVDSEGDVIILPGESNGDGTFSVKGSADSNATYEIIYEDIADGEIPLTGHISEDGKLVDTEGNVVLVDTATESEESCIWHWLILTIALVGIALSVVIERKDRRFFFIAVVATLLLSLALAFLGTCMVDWIVMAAEALAMTGLTVFMMRKKA